ncbi:unnamed protein product [Cyprideis torosa]|uniref:Uncharacterized protein n=1 Tax=Cyprideis torosa TaxID=163714 RepID=A0A7R8ZKS8_9CRUS|nr:unnamed protein product [Cyprideis torosa]CAG0880847.1 unnamed protein product [Cyprideis torosa]
MSSARDTMRRQTTRKSLPSDLEGNPSIVKLSSLFIPPTTHEILAMKRLSMTGDEKSGGAISSLSTSEAPAPESTPTPAPQTSSTQQDFLHEEISEETPILDRQQKPPDKQIRITRTSSDEATKKNTRLSPPTEDPLSAPKEDCRLTEDESFEQRPRSTGGIVRKNSIWVRAAKSKKQGPFQKARPPDQSMGSFIIEKLSNFVTMLREIERPEDLKLRLVVGFLFCVIFCGLFATYYHYYRKTVEKKVGDILRFRYIQREVLVVSETREEPLLKGLLGVNFPDDVGNPFPCLRRATLDSRDFCLEWRKRARVHVTAFNSSSKFQCVSIAWDSLTVPIGALEDCFALGGAQWFSPGASIMWNTNQQMSQAVPYLNGIFASFVKRDWITSTGLQITVPPTVSLHVSVNKLPGHVCFRSDYNLRYIRGLESESTLKYSICHTRRPFEATLGRNRELFRLRKLPELRRKKEKAGPYLFFRPIDSHYPFSQEGVINMTQEFLGNGTGNPPTFLYLALAFTTFIYEKGAA